MGEGHHAVTQAEAARLADPNPPKDGGSVYAAVFYLLLTPCVASGMLIAGAVLCFNPRLRPFVFGVMGGVAISSLIAVVLWRARTSVPAEPA